MSNTEFSGIGFAPGVVTGVRSFDVDKLGRLTGVTHKQVWTPGENAAECRAASDPYASGGWTNLSYNFIIKGIAGPGTVQVATSEPAEKNLLDYSKPHDMEKCAHGFYAYYDGSNDYHDRGRVSAVIEGYGETLIGTRGFRAMKARIVALRINKEVPVHVAAMVARNYRDIPQFDSFKDMIREFPPDGGELQVTPEADPDFWTRKI